MGSLAKQTSATHNASLTKYVSNDTEWQVGTDLAQTKSKTFEIGNPYIGFGGVFTIDGNTGEVSVNGVSQMRKSVTLPEVTNVTITGISAAASAVVTAASHGLTTGMYVNISGSNSTPSINGLRKVTVLTANTFSISVTTTVAGSAGTVKKDTVEMFRGDASSNQMTTWMIHSFQNGGASMESYIGTNFNTATGAIFLLKPQNTYIYAAEETSPILSGTYLNESTDCVLLLTHASTTRVKSITFRRLI